MQKRSFLSSKSETFRFRYEKQPHYAPLQAVTAAQGHPLVIAGTGRGKTRTITNRLVRTVEDGTSAASILLLAFSRKAARQILLRVAELLLPDRRSAKRDA